jgi:hypothetical protein
MAKKETKDKPLVSLSGQADEFGRPIVPDKPERPQGFDASDPRHIEAAKKESGRQKREDRDFWQMCMSTPQRRASLYRLLERCHIYSTPADTESVNRTFFKLGEENVGKQIMLSAMDASTDLYLKMLKEQKELREAKERKNDD